MANPEHLAILEKGLKTWNQWRLESPGFFPRSKSADLSGVAFSGADLGGADFSAAYLHHADFSEANLSHARLEAADLTFANLTGAGLNAAYLFMTNFHSTMLAGADFSGAHALGTVFANVDLSLTRGLDLVEHSGPSTIGFDTLRRSNGKIPEIFLRGAGVPDSLILYAQSLLNHPIEFYSGFISYSHADKSFSRRLHDALQDSKIRCWLDEHQLLPGDDIYEHVDRGIHLYDKVLLCCSEASLTSWWVDNEIGIAFEREQQLTKERGHKVQVLIPLNLDGYLFSDEWQGAYRTQIRRRLAADFTGWESKTGKFEAELENVIRALRADEAARQQPPKSML